MCVAQERCRVLPHNRSMCVGTCHTGCKFARAQPAAQRNAPFGKSRMDWLAVCIADYDWMVPDRGSGFHAPRGFHSPRGVNESNPADLV